MSMIAVGLQFHENGTLMKRRTKNNEADKMKITFPVLYKSTFLNSPCQIGSDQLQTWLLPEHTEHPSRPPGHKNNFHIFIELLWAPFRENITSLYTTFLYIYLADTVFTQQLYDVAITHIMFKLTN